MPNEDPFLTPSEKAIMSGMTGPENGQQNVSVTNLLAV
jgi:hypothetical protein